ncbi:MULTISPECIES: hypothetical protein [Lacrimispora]|jgi:hypothetical protein|uniref:hypothetical protein n=1 Tax=Lacrimispora TaxID=2719231 RepID=UPI000BE29451|nr:hypothetical protein [Lacrimispora amygdalina]MDK2968053.1 hypothetical protein [Lacrimispora sp.]
MKKSYLVDTFKAAVSIATVLFSLTIVISLIIIHRFGSAAVFFLIGLIFIKPVFTYAAFVSVDQTGIRLFLPWKTLQCFTWSEIAEVGVAGTRLFTKKESKNAGSLYIYISKTTLTDDDRFDMMLHWPPKNQIFLTYSKQRLDEIQMRFSNKIQTYNAGDIHL